jgi:hypothetical protein
MPLTLTWREIALRLALSLIAAALIGLDRGEHGRPAGLRTTLLVCLAACVAIIQTSLLLAAKGRPADSFIMLDLMRLPLGILTGMGFIGGGAILQAGSCFLCSLREISLTPGHVRKTYRAYPSLMQSCRHAPLSSPTPSQSNRSPGPGAAIRACPPNKKSR